MCVMCVSPPVPPTGTKLCATLGPSCHEVDVLAEMLVNGLVAGRVDLTWVSGAHHGQRWGE